MWAGRLTRGVSIATKFSFVTFLLQEKSKTTLKNGRVCTRDQQSPQTAKTPSPLIRPLPEQHHRNGREHDLQIKEHRLILCVVEIEKDHFTKTDMASSGDLP